MKRAICVVSLSLLTVLSCTEAPPEDSLCSFEPLPDTTRAEAGQGAILIVGSTDEYFYVNDKAGQQVASGSVGTAVAVQPGEYRVQLNRSTLPAPVRERTLTKCAAGAVLLSGSTNEYYYVLDTTGSQLASNSIGRPLGLFPGKYRVQVNKTSQETEIKPGAVTEVKAGLLVARGSTDEYYYVLDSTGNQLASGKLSAPLSLLAGKLTVKINNTQAPVEVKAGGTIELQTGALLVLGTTNEYYYVLDTIGNQLASQKLSQSLSFVEGDYTVKLNNSRLAVRVEAGATSEHQTATLVVKSTADAYYYVLDANGNQLASNKLNQPLAFPEGSYSVKVDNDTRPVSLTAGETTTVNW